MEHVVELFVADHCPSCPAARHRVREFAQQRPNVIVIERNVTEAREVATAYGLFATPAVVVDRRSIFYGVPTLAQLAARCEGPDVTRTERSDPHGARRPATGAVP